MVRASEEKEEDSGGVMRRRWGRAEGEMEEVYLNLKSSLEESLWDARMAEVLMAGGGGGGGGGVS